jgi:hypothetical protein
MHADARRWRRIDSGTDLSTTGMAPCPCTRPSIRKLVKCWARPRSGTPRGEFVAFLTDIVINQPRGKEIHVIADNLRHFVKTAKNRR